MVEPPGNSEVKFLWWLKPNYCLVQTWHLAKVLTNFLKTSRTWLQLHVSQTEFASCLHVAFKVLLFPLDDILSDGELPVLLFSLIGKSIQLFFTSTKHCCSQHRAEDKD